MDDVVDVLEADRDADHVLGDAGVGAFLFRKLLVGRGPWVDGEGLGVADAVKFVRLNPTDSTSQRSQEGGG